MSEKEISEKMQDIMSRMKKRREELDMSYQTLSDKVGISKSTLQRYETGYIKNMPVDKLEDIANALRVSPAYLMGWTDEVVDQPITLAAHFDGDEYTEDELDEIRQFVEFVKCIYPGNWEGSFHLLRRSYEGGGNYEYI